MLNDEIIIDNSGECSTASSLSLFFTRQEYLRLVQIDSTCKQQVQCGQDEVVSKEAGKKFED